MPWWSLAQHQHNQSQWRQFFWIRASPCSWLSNNQAQNTGVCQLSGSASSFELWNLPKLSLSASYPTSRAHSYKSDYTWISDWSHISIRVRYKLDWDFSRKLKSLDWIEPCPSRSSSGARWTQFSGTIWRRALWPLRWGLLEIWRQFSRLELALGQTARTRVGTRVRHFGTETVSSSGCSRLFACRLSRASCRQSGKYLDAREAMTVQKLKAKMEIRATLVL